MKPRPIGAPAFLAWRLGGKGRAGTVRFRRRSASVLGGCAAVALAVAAVGVLAGEAPSEKRVEHRGNDIQSSPSPAGPTPARPRETPPSSKPPEPHDKDFRPCPEHTPATEESKTEVPQQVVVVEVPRPAEAAPEYLTFPEILQDSVGRPRADGVIACTDPRYPLPAYAWVGLQPHLAYKADGDVIRLQRLDLELEVGPDWRPGDSILTLVVATSVFSIALPDEDRTDLSLVSEVRSGRTYPLSVGAAKTGSLARTTRYVVSLQFNSAASGKAPILRPGDGVHLQMSPSPTAPPTYDMPRFLLVPGVPGVPSTLQLIEKTGSLTRVVPALQELELSAFLSVVHRIPQ